MLASTVLTACTGSERDTGGPRPTAPAKPQYKDYYAWAWQPGKFGMLDFRVYPGQGNQLTGHYTQVTWADDGTKLPELPQPFNGSVQVPNSTFTLSGLRRTSGGDITATLSEDGARLTLDNELTGVPKTE
ncbi:hypothetical protein AB0C84_40310 [Actinomadura sp. NPDC048955]|uniref:hypothetical protein n=1 Tax=Actinomadura sp. NPDC048955 TaxID=3158228 RepID=UPI0033E8C4CC